MDDRDWLAERFEAHRPRLRAVAWRLLGSAAEADDAVQETWLRLSRTDPAGVDNLGGWLTTVVARVCLNQLRSRRPEEPLDDRVPEPPAEGLGPEDEALVADAVGPALLVVLASRGGDLQALLSLLDPQVVLRSDPAAVAAGTPAELRGAAEVAGSFAGRARAARPAMVDGAAGLVWAPGGRPRMAFAFTVADGRITEIRLLADPERLRRVELVGPDQAG